MPQRRTELAAFLRSRRARITPADVGMPPGFRRRTPGLRREEVAQLSGVGVTWYTWLEQGRPINASVQVLEAIARTLRLDVTERQHLYRLAGVPFVADDIPDAEAVGTEVQGIIDALDPLCAVVYNARYDVRASNAAYRDLFPAVQITGRADRNVLLRLFTGPACCSAFLNRAEELPRMVAQLRGAYGRHVGEPAWESFIERLIRESAEFAQMWASGDVAPAGPRIKLVQHASVGIIHLTSVSLAIDGMPEHRIVVYTPNDEDSRARIEQLRGMNDPLLGCPVHARRLSEISAEIAEKQMSPAL
ncbi:helix-turn-helix transcriptional regulator [Actinacidiphila soli]|jgi:transcriptional regulator with XRE-family HTH domain|uniref:helix-turn-helix transcriptional regulator n=1 Tax=Actinacidiphila soli TaxID=2487275 RepID=UPI000FCBC1F3|nr:helix-turn-helix transcriptional regulator [Actinacidiphila soli]